MAYLVCRVSRFYGMTYRDVMTLPVRMFWVMVDCIDRLRAEEELRVVGVQLGVQSAEGHRQLVERLHRERGEPVTYSPLAPHLHQRDEEGVKRLKLMAMGAL